VDMKPVIISFNENRVILSKVSITKSKPSSVAAGVYMNNVGYPKIYDSVSKAGVYLVIIPNTISSGHPMKSGKAPDFLSLFCKLYLDKVTLIGQGIHFL